MKKVFVSYPHNREDTAMDIVRYLESQGLECFINKRDIKGGKPFAQELVAAIRECEILLLVSYKDINESEHVPNEIDIAVTNKKVLLPVFAEEFELKDELRYYLGRKHWILAYPHPLNSYYDEIYNAVVENLPADKRPALADSIPDIVEEPTDKTTVFKYNSERGVMTNPEDHQRNVSFRVDTFVNMMGGIFAKVKDLVGEEEAENVFYESGYSSGKNFGERINNEWDTAFSAEGLQMKFDKWCQFDSKVGWGKFSATVELDEEQDTVRGTICINEAFIVDNKNKRKICAFIRGYCTGVVGVFLNAPDDVVLTCRECPMQSRVGTKCVFDFELK